MCLISHRQRYNNTFKKTIFVTKGLVTNYREAGCKTGGGGACEVLPLQNKGGGGGRTSFSHAEGGDTKSFGVIFT